tara:strand:+ start:105 stop:569 length:465 start_codon:yes stop_codon:yes gene_type:complete
MSINKRQFELLQAMGITVWQRRDLSGHSPTVSTSDPVEKADHVSDSGNGVTEQLSSSQTSNEKTPNNGSIAIDLKALLKQPLFHDIIRCLGVSSADLSINHNQIDLGIINWQFTSNEEIELKHNCLKTPELATLANSPILKKSLWQSIGPLSSI